MDYSRKLKLIRETLGLSQEAIGKRVGLSGAHISRLETGTYKITDKILDSYIDALGVDRVWLLSEENEAVNGSGKSAFPEKAVFSEKRVEGVETLVDRVKTLRLKLGLSQNKFAENAGIPTATLNRFEAGKSGFAPESLKKIAEAYNVGLDWLQYGDERKKDFPVGDRLIEFLWAHKELREMLYHEMEKAEEAEKGKLGNQA